MATLLYRLGRASFRRRKLVVILWAVLLAALGCAALAFRGPSSSDFTMPGTESQRAIDALQREFPEAGGATGTIVVAAPAGGTVAGPALKPAVQGLVKEASGLPGVLGAVDPFAAGALSPDGRYALIQVQFATRADEVTERQRAAYERSGAAAEAAGLRVEHGGEVMNSEPEVGGTDPMQALSSPALRGLLQSLKDSSATLAPAIGALVSQVGHRAEASVLSGANAYSAGTMFNQGTVAVTTDANLGNATANTATTIYQADYNRLFEMARGPLDEASFAAACSSGRALAIEQVLALAERVSAGG